MNEGVVQGGNRRRTQVRAERKDAFTAEKKQLFLDHLAGCCTILHSAKAAGVALSTFYTHRRRDPEFAQACAEALAVGYERLEAMMLARAAGGGEPIAGADSGQPGLETMDTALAQFLLSVRAREMGRRTGNTARPPSRASEKELNAAILAKLDLLDQRLRREREGKRK